VSLPLDLQAIFPIIAYRLRRHDIYKWQSDQRRQSMRVRSASFAAPPAPTDPALSTFTSLEASDGTRAVRANEQGTEEPQILTIY